MMIAPELRIALTTFVCAYLIADALCGERIFVRVFVTTILGFVLVGCWQLWSIAGALGAGAVTLAIGLAGKRELTNDRRSAKRWLAYQLTTLAGIIAATIASFTLLSENPYTLIDATGPVVYAALIVATGAAVAVGSGSNFMTAAIRPVANQLRLRAGVDETHIEPADGFIAGGRTIGRYERLLVFILVLTNAATAIGFLIAAKSIFRFGDITDSANRQKAEYILLGTLMSFTFALVVSLIAKTVLEWF